MGVRIILTTGGTGGHIFPALAVAEQLRREGAELLFVGSQYGSEAKLAKQAGLEFRGLPVRGVLGRGLRSVGALWGLFRAVFMARAIVKDFRPDAVIGFGAYASFPSLVAAKLSGVPIAVHEQNAMPGLTNRMLAKLAKRVFLSLPDVTGAFDAKKSQLTGNPVREAIVESGENAVGHPGTRRLLVMGGSQGAKAVNSVILASLERLTKAGDRNPASDRLFRSGARACRVSGARCRRFGRDAVYRRCGRGVSVGRSGVVPGRGYVRGRTGRSRKTRRARALPLCDSRSSDIQRSGYG